MNKRENEIYEDLYKNKGKMTVENYLKTCQLLKDDDEKIEQAKKLLENQLKKIQMIFGRLSPEANLEQQSIEDWIFYIYGGK